MTRQLEDYRRIIKCVADEFNDDKEELKKNILF